MAIELTSSDVDEQPQQAAPSTPSNSTIMPTDPSDPGINTTPRPPAALTADDVDSLPPGLMKKPAPPDQSQTMAVANPKGLVEPGTLPIWNRPTVQNADGSHSSELSFSREDDDGNEVLVPSVVNGKFMTDDGKMPPLGHEDPKTGKYIPTPEEKKMQDRAWAHYEQTGEHLGKFKDPDSADAYADILHNRGDAKSQADLAKPKPSVIDNIRKTHPDFGKRVRVNGVEGTIIGRHPESKKFVVHWDK